MIETLSYIDWFSLTIIFIFAVMGFFNGFIKEVFSAAAWILSLSLAWLYGPIFFPYVEVYVDASTWVNIFSFIALFLVCFIILKFTGVVFSRLISVIRLKFVDRLFGTFFGSLKMLAILTSVFVFNLNFFDKYQWWLDSYSRIYSIKFYELSQPIFEEWLENSEVILDKDNPEIKV